MIKKIGFIHLFFGMIAFGIYHYNLQGPDLAWNMFLALVALDFSLVTYYVRFRVVKYASLLLWLFFYPNTFYMLTDIVHMHFASTVLWDKTSLILYMLYVSSILFGVLVSKATHLQFHHKCFVIYRHYVFPLMSEFYYSLVLWLL